MTRPHLIARLILAAMGVYLLMRSLSWIGSAAVRLNVQCPPESFPTTIFVIAVELILSLTASLIFLFKSENLVQMLTGPDIDQCVKVDNLWVITGLQMTACFCGLLILFPRIERLFFYVPAIIKGTNILSYLTIEGQTSVIPVKRTVGFLMEITKLIFAIYLIFGAPHYVRWQMRSISAKREVKNE